MTFWCYGFDKFVLVSHLTGRTRLVRDVEEHGRQWKEDSNVILLRLLALTFCRGERLKGKQPVDTCAFVIDLLSTRCDQ